MKRLLSLLSLLLSLALVLVVVLLLGVMLVTIELDATLFKDRLAAEVSERSAWELGIDGRLVLVTGPQLGLRAWGMALGQSSADGGEGIRVEANEAALALDTLALLGGRLQPIEVTLADAEVRVGGGSGDANGDEARTPSEPLHRDWPRLLLRNTRFVLLRPQTQERTEILLEQAALAPIDVEGYRWQGELAALVDGLPLAGSGRVGALFALDDGVPVDLRLDAAGMTLDIDGELSRIGGRLAANLEIGIDSPAPAKQLPWLAVAGLDQGPLATRLRLRGSQPRFEVELTSLHLAAVRLSGLGYLDFSGERPALNLRVEANRLDLRDWLNDREPAASADPDRPFNLTWMDRAEIDLALDLARLELPHASARARMILSLRPSQLDLSLSSRASAGASTEIKLTLDRGPGPPSLALSADLRALALAPLLESGPAADAIDGAMDLSAELRSRGASRRDVIEGLSGTVLLYVPDAMADLSHLDRMTPGARNLFGLLGKPDTRHARINCALAGMTFGDRQVALDGLVDSEDALVMADGAIDLRAETLKLRLVPHPKGVHLKIAAPVLVSGELARPKIKVEEVGLVIALTRIASKVALPELMLVEAFGEGLAESPCLRAGRTERSGRVIGNGAAANAVRGAGKRLIDGARELRQGIVEPRPPGRGPSGFEVE